MYSLIKYKHNYLETTVFISYTPTANVVSSDDKISKTNF